MFGKLYRALAEDIRTNPQNWEITQFHAKHTSGFSLWIANGPTFLSADGSTNKMNMLGPLLPWRRALWNAIHELKDKKIFVRISGGAA